jgi:pimeloyl-ACP methyl ester carboxylesterase
VSDALAVLDQNDLAAATVLGHSWGGYLAMQLAARAPGRVTALVLADPLGAVGDGGVAGFGAELEARATPETRARIAELDELQTTSKEQEAAVALEYFRLEWPGYFAVPADAPPVPDTVRLGPEGLSRHPPRSPRPPSAVTCRAC